MHHHRMHVLTNEDALLSASRSAAALTGEELIRDTNDNSGTILEVDRNADDSVSGPQVGAHGSYSFSMHVLTIPPICVLKEAKEKSKDLLAPPEDENRAGSKNGSKVSLLDLPSDKLKQWLSPPNHLVDHVDAHPETGKWFIQSNTFQWWKRKEKGASLFICGESMFLQPAAPPRLLITSSLSQPGRERLCFGMQFPERSVR
jgi:hypothetical protein